MQRTYLHFGFEFGNVTVLKESIKFQILPKNKIQ